MYNLSTDSWQLPITCIVISSDSKQQFLTVRQSKMFTSVKDVAEFSRGSSYYMTWNPARAIHQLACQSV